MLFCALLLSCFCRAFVGFCRTHTQTRINKQIEKMSDDKSSNCGSLFNHPYVAIGVLALGVGVGLGSSLKGLGYWWDSWRTGQECRLSIQTGSAQRVSWRGKCRDMPPFAEVVYNNRLDAVMAAHPVGSLGPVSSSAPTVVVPRVE